MSARVRCPVSGNTALWLALGLAASSAGCERRADSAASPAVVEVSRARRLATPTAFDLAPAPAGAVLAWAAAGASHISVRHLDADGRDTRGPPSASRVMGAGAAVADLALTSTATGVCMAWSETAESAEPAGALRAAWLAASGEARTFELGAGFRNDGSSRGALALVPRDRGALLLARGPSATCSSTREHDCSSFQFFEVGPDAARATGLGLTVPSPCAMHSAQLVSARGGAGGAPGPFEYAICAGSAGATALTVFSIQPNPAYAAAEEALAGCEPLGAGRFGGEATFVAECAGRRRSVSVPSDGGALIVRDLDLLGLICNAGGPVLRFGGGWLRLSEPLGHLQALLNDDLAPRGARAVWTGATLLVAQARDGRLALSRHACRDARLVELEAMPDAGTDNRQ